MNKILKSFKQDGTECNLIECDYIQLELLGDHAINNDAKTLVNQKCLPFVLSFKWYLGKDGYPISFGSNDDTQINLGRGVKLHQLLCSQYIGAIPKGCVVDHINRNKLDNRLENLRICSQRENSYNTSRRNNKFKGIKKMKDGWCAKITKDGNTHIIKNIQSEIEAAKIYDMMAEELFGQFAGKNYYS